MTAFFLIVLAVISILYYTRRIWIPASLRFFIRQIAKKAQNAQRHPYRKYEEGETIIDSRPSPNNRGVKMKKPVGEYVDFEEVD
ncbi:MAG: hypothetical protein V6Z82_05345 [Flavobacteriales bacterium]